MEQLITRINYGLMTGDFELDFQGGEIRFRRIGAEGDRLSTALVREMMFDIGCKKSKE